MGLCTWTWYQDVDGDGFGNPYMTTTTACGVTTAPVGYVANNLDSNDAVSGSPIWFGATSAVSSYASAAPTVAFSADSTPYVMFVNFSSRKLNVSKMTGSSWNVVGVSDFSSSIISNVSAGIAFDQNSPYVSYPDNSGTVVVMAYTGTGPTGWQTIGSTGTSSVTETNIDIYSGVPYVVYNNGLNIQVMKYVSGAWTAVGGVIGTGVSPNIVLDSNGIPYVSFVDNGTSTKITVKRFNGASWVTVGVPGFSAGSVDSPVPQILVDGSNNPYVIYYDGDNNQVVVEEYISGAWSIVGNNALYSNQPNGLSVSIDYWGNPYVAYSDGVNYTVKRLVSGSWVALGPDPVTSDTGLAIAGGEISVAVDGAGVPYISYVNQNQSDGVSVLSLEDSLTPLPAALVFFSGTSDHDGLRLMWSTASETNFDYFLLERSSDRINFETIARLQGQNRSSQVEKYSYEDHPTNELNYYRLKSVDLNGKFEYSKVIPLKLKTSLSKSFAIYPNPNSGNYLFLKLKVDPVQGDHIQIINILGNIVYSTTVKDTTLEIVFGDRLNTGQYIVNYFSGEQRFSTRMVVVQ